MKTCTKVFIILNVYHICFIELCFHSNSKVKIIFITWAKIIYNIYIKCHFRVAFMLPKRDHLNRRILLIRPGKAHNPHLVE